MRINITHEHVARWIPGLSFTVLLAAVLGWAVLNWTLRPANPVAPAAPRTQPLAQATASFVLGPDMPPASLAASGPVSGAADATARAMAAANSAARRDYGVEPFTDAKTTARFDGQLWVWRTRIASGRGDLEAEVTVAPDGTTRSVRVMYLTQGLGEI